MYYIRTSDSGSLIISTEKPIEGDYIKTEDITPYTQTQEDPPYESINPDDADKESNVWDELAQAIKAGVNEV